MMLITKLGDRLKNKVFPLKLLFIEKYSDMRYQSSHRPILIHKADSKELRLNIVVPTVNERDVFGGISTALRLFTGCYQKLNCDARIISLNQYDQLYNKIPAEFSQKYEKKHTIKIVEIDQTTIDVREKDIFIATYWSTALLCETMISRQCEYYKTYNPILFYLIQDYEPGFYPWSTEYVESERTYRFPFKTFAIFNSLQLRDYFNEMGYKFYKTLYFEPVLNEYLKSYLLSHRKELHKREKIILVYGRPQEHRNAYTLVVDALKKFSLLLGREEAKEWRLISLGAKHKNVRLNNGMILYSLGKVSMEKYAEFMINAYMGISLMISPHPSYPPLEMSTFGMKTVTNQFANKDLSGFNRNIYSLSKYDSENLAKKLYQIIQEYPGDSAVEINNSYVNGSDGIDHMIEMLCRTIGQE